MRRKTIGFLVLALVVAAGIVFVEQRLSDVGGADAWSDVDSSVYRVVLGGAPPAEQASEDPRRAEEARTTPVEPPRTAHVGPDRPPRTARAPDPTAPPSPPPSEFRYVVRKGDVLGAVVLAHLGTASPRAVERVARDSGLADPDQVAAGQELVLRVDVWEQLEAQGDESLHDLARRAYGAPGRTAALRLANPHLPPTDDAVVPAGAPVWVAR